MVEYNDSYSTFTVMMMMSSRTCRWRMVLSTCVFIWSISSLFFTHKLLKYDVVRKDETEETWISDTDCGDTSDTDHKRQIVRGWFDFHGELLNINNIGRDNSDNFSDQATELNMRVGVGRHDHSFSYIIYDQVRINIFRELCEDDDNDANSSGDIRVSQNQLK